MECTPGTATEGCCWWGRGAIQTTGPYNYGQLQADVVSRLPGYENVDLCSNPEALCQNDGLKFVGALYYWTSMVQQEACFDAALDLVVANGSFDYNAAPPNCYKFSSGAG